MSALQPTHEYRPLAIAPNRYLEGYIALRQCFEGRSEYMLALEEYGMQGLRDELADIIASDDSHQRATILALPLSRAVSAGARMLKAEGEQSLTTSTNFRGKLRVLLQDEYQIAVEAVLPDDSFIPPFPYEDRRLAGALMHGPFSRKAVEGVQRMLASEILLEI